MNDYSTPVETFLNWLRECEQGYHMAVADEQEANDIQQDILHELELLEQSDEEMLALGHEVKQARQKRREAKDKIMVLELLLSWLEEHRSGVKSLERLLGEIRKAERKTENRIYTPRAKR